MKAIITTFDLARNDQALTLTLATTGPLDVAAKERLYDLFRSSAVLELHVSHDGAATISVARSSPQPGSA